ncbi:MAG: hypothetical protein KDN18_17850 [Verrucomicrobiae bacterium]|nr:hypothetical protein [Verrucomicrobiae bacterium]
MAHQILPVTATPEERNEIAAFLAGFVRAGGLLKPRPGDDTPSKWLDRMRWWWDENPACRPGSPRGFLLRNDDAEVVGFSGLIPFPYESAGEPVPALVTTSFFVEESHRSAVMGLIARQRELGRKFHIVDGSASPEMRRLLERLGYEAGGLRAQYFFPTRRLGGFPAHALLLARGWTFPVASSDEVADFRLVTHPSEWHEPAPKGERGIRLDLHNGSLSWLVRSGSEPRRFFGLVDSEDKPVARALGVYKRHAGLLSCHLLDHRDFHSGGAGLSLLIGKILRTQGDEGLDPATSLVILSRFGHHTSLGMPGHPAGSNLFFHLPPSLQGVEKECLPIEGDLVLL